MGHVLTNLGHWAGLSWTLWLLAAALVAGAVKLELLYLRRRRADAATKRRLSAP